MGPGAEDATESEEAALAAMRWYRCSGSFGSDSLSQLEVGISATRLQVTDLSKEAASPDMGTLDKTYKPTAAFAGSTRFSGFEKMKSDLPSDVGAVDFIVSKELSAKAATAGLALRTSGSEGGRTTRYTCHAKNARLAVEVSRNARLSCSLDKLSCESGNPPGETCLSELFVLQGKSGASLRLTFLDHFGVNVKVRKENVGSADLHRTTTKASGSWSDNDLSLSYRAGITYTGMFTLPDGRKSAVHCNDLAMLDD